MAEEDDDLEIKPAGAGAMFRAEMAATNFLMGYWKGLVALVVVGLACILFFGQYSAFLVGQQRGTAAQIADVESRLNVPIIQVAEGLEAGVVDRETITQAGRDLVVIANGATGTARVEASLKAAELFRVVGANDERRTALEGALDHAEGVLAYSAQGALANLELEQGNGDAAVERWKALIASEDGFLAEQSMLELGLALEALDRNDEAKQIYADFLQTYPNSTRKEKAEARAARLDSNG